MAVIRSRLKSLQKWHPRPGDIQAGDPVPIHRQRRNQPRATTLSDTRYRREDDAKLLLLKLPFIRLVREIVTNCCRPRDKEFTWQTQAIQALQEAAEAFMIHLFEDAQLCAIHAKQITRLHRGIRPARRIRGIWAGLGSPLKGNSCYNAP
ncbi:uncharacterized protein UV8b_03739 [Ustilaginoidea virens]|uniref:Core Histone H2A/H2B/H3 domain-containing protein n=1 Tax=Ustilaginoidea virens TaxID=1159556 RepID=A0A8E5HQC3_USTVR|nr:uncharacterized protein UV8b_03739 [Ustilaginoidea virens]QUC19498.1 hypothetical protein UV8b_03739 [Ustilaginoidea virens]